MFRPMPYDEIPGSVRIRIDEGNEWRFDAIASPSAGGSRAVANVDCAVAIPQRSARRIRRTSSVIARAFSRWVSHQSHARP